MKMNNRVELCCHTGMSRLQGFNNAREYIEEAIKRGDNGIAITDKNSSQAFFDADNYIKKYTENKDFKIIYGTEMDFKENENTDKKYSIYIYVKEQKGLKNLYRIISESYEHLDFDEPVIYKKELNKNREGLLFAAIGRNSEIYQNIDNSDIIDKIKYYDFIGIEPNESMKKINKKINDICKKLNKILIGTSECNFINKKDYKSNEMLNFYKKVNNLEKGNNNYFQTTEELIEKFNYIENPEKIVVENPIKIAQKIKEINLTQVKAKYPEIDSADKIISEKCYEKVYKIYGEKLSEKVKERLQLELNSIIQNNFQSIYLIYSEIVEYSNELGYEVGNRGYIGCSLVAYLLGITNIDPIKYNLPFEMFAGKNYDKEPDISLNFSGKIRDKIITYLQNKFGKGKIILEGTIRTLACTTLFDCWDEYKKKFKIDNFEEAEVLNKLLGVKRTTGEHPGGVIIINKDQDILDFCPTEISNGYKKTHNTYRSICNSGLYKFTILSNDAPTMLHELEKETNTSEKDINFEDKETLKAFLHANDKKYKISTNGIPEFGTKYAKKIIEIVKPKNFNDLVYILAISRGSNTWNRDISTFIKKELKKIDEVITSREDMYNYLVEKNIDSHIAFEIVNFVGIGKAKKNKFNEDNEQWGKYKKIMKEHNIPQWYIDSAEEIIYIHSKSYSISYTKNAFKIMWYKINYPEAFYKTYFKIKSNLKIEDYSGIKEIKKELKGLYNKKYENENGKNFVFDSEIDDKIKDLELMLEMYER